MIRAIGPRAVIRPIETAPQSAILELPRDKSTVEAPGGALITLVESGKLKEGDPLIELTDRVAPCVGEVLSVGREKCEECGHEHGPQVRAGDVVLIPPHGGQEIEVDGETLWVVRLEHIIGHWQADERASA